MRKPSSPVGHLKIIMHKLRSVTLLCAGICAGVLSTVGITAYAEKQSAAPLPLAEIRQFTSAFNAIKDFYVDDVSDAKLLQSAVDGMVSGLGLEVTKDPAGVRVISPIDDTPAARAGMRAGDIITRIDGKSVADMSLNAAVKLMRGQPNTKIELVVARKGANKPLNFSLVRALIKTQSVKMKKLDEKVGYIRISQFQERTAEDLSKYLDELAKDGHLEGLVLDLRNDPGGLLQAAIGVSAAFLPKGSDVVSTKGRQAQSDYTFKAVEADYRAGNAVRALSGLTPVAKKVPIVVLINSSSASASEIVAGALQDHKRATIMGDRSFGKGSVQTIMPMKFGDKTVAVKLTTARYYTPSGRSIQAKGIIPDIYVDDTPKGNYPSFQIREADLTHHLINQDENKDEKDLLKDLPYDDEEGEIPDYQYMFGDDKDWQLQQAVNFLKNKPVAESKYRGKSRDLVKKLKAEAAAEKLKADRAKASKMEKKAEDAKADKAEDAKTEN